MGLTGGTKRLTHNIFEIFMNRSELLRDMCKAAPTRYLFFTSGSVCDVKRWQIDFLVAVLWHGFALSVDENDRDRGSWNDTLEQQPAQGHLTRRNEHFRLPRNLSIIQYAQRSNNKISNFMLCRDGLFAGQDSKRGLGALRLFNMRADGCRARATTSEAINFNRQQTSANINYKFASRASTLEVFFCCSRSSLVNRLCLSMCSFRS